MRAPVVSGNISRVFFEDSELAFCFNVLTFLWGFVAFKEFTEKINEQIKRNSMVPEQVEPIRGSINELAKETEAISHNEEPSILKQQSWKEKFFRVLKNVLPVLPKTAETIAAFTPLAPF